MHRFRTSPDKPNDDFETWAKQNREELTEKLCEALSRNAVQEAEKTLEKLNREHGTSAKLPGDWRERLKNWACGGAAGRLLPSLLAELRRRHTTIPPQNLDEIIEELAAYEAGEEARFFIHRELNAAVKSWFSQHDERVCPICIRNEAAEFIPIRQPFPSGHQRPPAHHRCRCSLDFSKVPRAMLLRL